VSERIIADRGRTGLPVLVRAELAEQLGQLILSGDVENIRWAQLLQVSRKALVNLDTLAHARQRRRVRQF
jgi:hypothetical protein